MNENSIIEIRNNKQKDKKGVIILFVVLNIITIPLIAILEVTIDVVLVLYGSYVISCGFTLLIISVKNDELMTIDAKGIKSEKQETSWEDTMSCYFDIWGKSSMVLVFELKNGKKNYYHMRSLRYDKYEIAKYANKFAMREVFDIYTTAKNIASPAAMGYSMLLILPLFFIIQVGKLSFITFMFIFLVGWTIAYFTCKKIVRGYFEIKFEKATSF